jgi:hypothetical protein
MESLIIAIGLLIVALAFCVRFILPREVWTQVLGEIIHDGLQGIWHLVFGPRKVRIVRGKKGKSAGIVRRSQAPQRKRGGTG